MGNQLEEIKKLYSIPKSYLVPKDPKEGQEQVKLEIRPLTLDEMSALNMGNDMTLSESAEMSIKMISKCLDMDEEDVKKISFEFMSDILDAVMNVNGMDSADLKKSGIQDFIEQKKKAIENNGKSN